MSGAQADMSEPSSSADAPSRVLARNSSVDAVVAVVLFVLGAVVVFQARALGSGWQNDGPGPGYFPFYIGLILCIASAGIFFQAVFSKKKDGRAFVDREQLGRVLSVFVPAIVYVLAIVFLGIYVASALYIAAFMRWQGKYRWSIVVLVSLAVPAVIFLLFELWFLIPLPKGPIERLLGF